MPAAAPPARSPERLVVIASYASVGVAAFLILIKTWAWFLTGSASLLGSLLDSLMDSIASVITVLGVRYSLKPPDADHRFGHGKAESLSALVQAAFIFGSALLLVLYCAERLLRPGEVVVEHVGAGLWVIGISLVATLGLLSFQSYVVRVSSSTAISADRLHYKSDVLMNLSVIVALLCARAGMPLVDLAFGLLIAGIIMHSAWQVGSEALHMLMDRELPPDVGQRIRDLALAHREVLGIHDLRTRRSGMRYMVQLHLEMADDTLLLDAHRVADEVEEALLLEFPGADVMIHQDPASMVAAERARAAAKRAAAASD